MEEDGLSRVSIVDARAETTMRTRAGDRDETMGDTDSSTRPTGVTDATNRRRDADTRTFKDSDDARDATTETLVDIMKLTRGGTSPNAAFARRDDDEDGDEIDEDTGTRYCSSCKHHLSTECFADAHRKTCATRLRRHKSYQRRKRWTRKKRE